MCKIFRWRVLKMIRTRCNCATVTNFYFPNVRPLPLYMLVLFMEVRLSFTYCNIVYWSFKWSMKCELVPVYCWPLPCTREWKWLYDDQDCVSYAPTSCQNTNYIFVWIVYVTEDRFDSLTELFYDGISIRERPHLMLTVLLLLSKYLWDGGLTDKVTCYISA